jgi:hypothetical protein
MAFKGKDPVRSKIIINDNILKQVSNFNYLGWNLSYNYNRDVQAKLARFQVMCGTIWQILGKQTRKATQLKFYKTMAGKAGYWEAKMKVVYSRLRWCSCMQWKGAHDLTTLEMKK